MKKAMFRKSFAMPVITIIFACLVVASFTTIGILEEAAQTVATSRKLPIYCVETQKKEIALTFDAAWGNSDTDVLIELLEKNEAKATFFTTGEWVEKYPKDVRKLYAAGHEIQNHSDKHPHPNELSYESLVQDTAACDEKIYAITGIYPTLYRAPYGEYNDKVIETMKSMRKQVIQWDVDSVDWKDPTPDEMVQRVLSKVGNGSILLFHNDAKNTPQALEKLLPELKNQGYEIKCVSEILIKGKFRMNNEGRMISAEDSAQNDSDSVIPDVINLAKGISEMLTQKHD